MERIANHPAVLAVETKLRTKGFEPRVVVLPESAPNAQAAADQIGCEVGAIANSLIFDADGAPLLVLTSGAHRVDTAKLAADLGVTSLGRATKEFVYEHTGQRIGGVAPVGHPAPVRTVIDMALRDYPEVWAAAGHAHTVFPLTFDELVRVTGGDVVAVN
ncbi:YbaK/EbsC family protein [Catenulispora yoronensis]|uniref:YbaK/EbsC family protein n=1 Tax=Catenulispora yoronensis TaxID=450799 RepID=A0ABN2UYP7_9ACTN